MVIAVNTRFLLPDQLEGVGYFIKEVFLRMAEQHPEHRFYFFFDRPYSASYNFPENVHLVVIRPPARHPLLWKFWYDIAVPLHLRKIKADVFVSPDGFCSLTTSVPQCMVIHDLGFLHQPDAYKTTHRRYLQMFMRRFVKKARAIATVSEYSKKDIVNSYTGAAEKIRVVYSAVKEGFQPTPYTEQESTREKYTGGKQYFIYVGALQPRKNLLNLLKGFSVFKNRLKSEMKLVLCGRMAWKNEELVKMLKTYKFRHDVLLTGYVSEKELVTLLGSAYAMVYPSFFEGFGVPVLEAMHCNVPALTSSGTSMEEIGADAALYFNPRDHKDIGDKMMMIYKDENLRSRLIENGKKTAAGYSWQKTADLLWLSVMDASIKK